MVTHIFSHNDFLRLQNTEKNRKKKKKKKNNLRANVVRN